MAFEELSGAAINNGQAVVLNPSGKQAIIRNEDLPFFMAFGRGAGLPALKRLFLSTNNRGFAGPTRPAGRVVHSSLRRRIGAAAFRQRRSEHRTRGSDFSVKPKNGPLARSASRSRLKTVWASRPLFRRSEKGVPFCRRQKVDGLQPAVVDTGSSFRFASR